MGAGTFSGKKKSKQAFLMLDRVAAQENN